MSPFYRAALASDFDVAFFQRETPMPRSWAKARNLSLVAVVVDTVGEPAGPATWPAARELTAWAEIAIMHRAGAPTGHYAHARELAKTHVHVLLIEAPADTFDDWLALLQRRSELAVEVIG